MYIYELNVWEGPDCHRNWLFTNKKEALADAEDFREQPWITEVWLRVWEKDGGGFRIVENGPIFQR